MIKLTKKDFYSSLASGLTTGVIAWRLTEYLKGLNVVYGIDLRWLIVIMPILWLLGVQLGYFLGRWFGFFAQFGKFAAIGFTNTAVDFGVFNLLFYISGENKHLFVLSTIASTSIGILHSYFWNKFWVFDDAKGSNAELTFPKFVVVTLIALLVNVGTAYVIFNWVHPVLGADLKGWANIGKVFGSASALIFSFVGYRMVVFKQDAIS